MDVYVCVHTPMLDWNQKDQYELNLNNIFDSSPNSTEFILAFPSSLFVTISPVVRNVVFLVHNMYTTLKVVS